MIFAYVCLLWFTFFLLNYAEITARPAKWLKRQLGPKWGYPLSCGACFPFWSTLFLWLVYPISIWWIPVATVLHLFVDLNYQRLSGQCPPCVEGDK